MKVYVTGSSGFIGSAVSSLLLKSDIQLLAHRRSKKYTKFSQCDGFTPLVKDLFHVTVSDLKDVDVILHLAATGVSPQKASWKQLYKVNVEGTLHACRLASNLNVPLVLAGSSLEYGLSGSRFKYIPVDAPLEPVSPYASSKACSSQLALGYARSEGLKLSYLRVFNAYGDGQNISNLWPSLKSAALNNLDFDLSPGDQVRDFVPISVVADFFKGIN